MDITNQCKWLRPFRSLFRACWNSKITQQEIGEDIGILNKEELKKCKNGARKCFAPLREKCKNCKHLFYSEERYNKYGDFYIPASVYCTKECYNFEKFKQKESNIDESNIDEYWEEHPFRYDWFGLIKKKTK
ncbi:MAG: hypothetical protein ACOC56_01015 [Atribacterota bacterium]